MSAPGDEWKFDLIWKTGVQLLLSHKAKYKIDSKFKINIVKFYASSSWSTYIVITIGRRAVDRKASPTGSVLDSTQRTTNNKR